MGEMKHVYPIFINCKCTNFMSRYFLNNHKNRGFHKHVVGPMISIDWKIICRIAKLMSMPS